MSQGDARLPLVSTLRAVILSLAGCADATPKEPRRQPLVGIGVVLAAVLLCGCYVTQAPLKPDHGYPADWPQLIALSEGLTELNGSYANKGIATTRDGKLVPIALTDLVPTTTPRNKGRAATGLSCEECVALRVLPPKGEFLSAPKLRFTLPPSSDPGVFDVPLSGNADTTLYVMQTFSQSLVVGLGYGATNVRLTCAMDGSLIAQVHSASGLLLLIVIPITIENDYIWARFERVGE